jgi:hypothetical protein
MKKSTISSKSSAPTTSSSANAPRAASRFASDLAKPKSAAGPQGGALGAAVAAQSPQAPAKTKVTPHLKPAIPLVRVEPSARPPTVINAKIDIGFGNSLFLRGVGPGLSWDKGIALACLASDHWSVSIKGAVQPIVFKLLVNDERWSAGADLVAEAGRETTVTPAF